ncbi:hypothetical protein [Acidisphaera sp. L21]|uniref:hypothetical protein n=1 Tax=Acidisphaera sp. L21 TaxID=1641851 RepID=UPI00131C787F|nr:hypothetical protein [Acidisphaera sp. L21]
MKLFAALAIFLLISGLAHTQSVRVIARPYDSAPYLPGDPIALQRVQQAAQVTQDRNNDSSGQHVTDSHGAIARTESAIASDVLNIVGFLPAAGNDIALALRNAYSALPAGGRIYIPYGRYQSLTCQSITTSQNVEVVGAGQGATQIIPQISGCAPLTVTEVDINKTLSFRDFSFGIPPNGIVPSVPLDVSFPVVSDPMTHVRKNGTYAQNLFIQNVQVLSSQVTPFSAYYMGGIKIYGAWNAMIDNVQVGCKGGGGRPTIGTSGAGFEYGQVESATFRNTSAFACYYGWSQTDYSEGVTLNKPQGVGNYISWFIANASGKVNGFSIDQLELVGAEFTAYASALFFNYTNQAFIHDNHLLVLADTNAVELTATSCPTANSAAQYALTFIGMQTSHVHDNELSGNIYTLNNGIHCTFVTGGEFYTAVSANDNTSNNQYAFFGAALTLDTSTLNITATNVDLTTTSSTGVAIIDNGTANTNAITYRSGNKIVSLH